MTAKYKSLPKDIEWHFIRHLQTNKIKYIVPYVALIHGMTPTNFSPKSTISSQSRTNRQLPAAAAFAQEETKFGFGFDECREMLAADEWKGNSSISRICGLMGMATNTDN